MTMSIEMQLLVGIALGFVLAGIEMGLFLHWDRIRSFFKKHPD